VLIKRILYRNHLLILVIEPIISEKNRREESIALIYTNKNFVGYYTLMNLKNVSIPLVITISLVLLLNAGSSNIYGQIIGQTNQTNQTSGKNTTQQAQQ
jgi:hypothetical protein